jgi:spore coat polysaccharide biosynthesis protein SpsF
VFSFFALKLAHREARLASEREHVTPYIWKNPHIFRLGTIKSSMDLSGLRWTVDDEKDLKVVKRIFEEFYPECRRFYTDDILGFLRRHPEVAAINSDTVRNEGYAKSLAEDKPVR